MIYYICIYNKYLLYIYTISGLSKTNKFQPKDITFMQTISTFLTPFNRVSPFNFPPRPESTESECPQYLRS